ncbi:hypothetical protein Y032_0108g57 [Ancylostoma ceylanicum]|uniref:Uncharacterized protein n=1 Tax=Ancylostoma ceylanicum TaxID=53326 RepID=A0A016TFB8_9BILA|nr:hypothetical protein Y032_0108g57 [Ancylostoma ceylanicum]
MSSSSVSAENCGDQENSAVSVTADHQALQRQSLGLFYPEVVFLGCYPRATKLQSPATICTAAQCFQLLLFLRNALQHIKTAITMQRACFDWRLQ